MNLTSISPHILCLLAIFGSENSAVADGINVKGRVVDGATGMPITMFVEQGGKADAKDPKKIEWGFFETRTAGEVADGRYQVKIDWKEGWRVRILANGYLPQMVLAEAPPNWAKDLEITVRMTRGREVAGMILDHKGKPIADASVFLVGKRPATITGGKALQSFDMGEDKTIARSKTADDGRFAILGAGDDIEHLAISAPGLDVWVVPLPENTAAPCNVRLPEPCRLTIKYEIAGAAAEGEFYLQMLTHENGEWVGVNNDHMPKLMNGGSLTLTNLAPGPYSITRTKKVQIGQMGFSTMLDRQRIVLKPGGKAEAIFVRDRGAALSGKIEMPDREKYEGAIVSVKPAEGSNDPLKPKFDSVKMEANGTFRTDKLMPGEYTVSVQAYEPEPPQAQFRTGRRGPSLVGSIKVTVPAEGAPKPVTIVLKQP